MTKNKFGIQFDGFKELMTQLDKLSGDLKKVTEEALITSHKIVTPRLHADTSKHYLTGDTERAIIDNARVEWNGTTASIAVGFDLSNGGLPSIFLMYGTPRMNKDTKLYNDIYGSAVKKQIAEEQEAIIKDAITKKLGG